MTDLQNIMEEIKRRTDHAESALQRIVDLDYRQALGAADLHSVIKAIAESALATMRGEG